MMSTCRLLMMRCMGCALLMALVQSHGTPSAPPKNILVSRRDAVAVCSTIQFQRKLLVSFQGRPGNITNADVQLFQRSFQQVYNSVKCGVNATLTFRRITNVNATRNAILSYGFTAANTASDFIDQQFTWIVQVQGTCRGCTTPTFQLFATDPPAPTPPTPPSSPPPSGCFCSPPRKVLFLRSLNRRSLRPNNIDKVLDIVLLFEQTRCPAVETQFESYLAVTYSGGNFTTFNSTTTNVTTQNQLLAQSVLETYNDANALNIAGVCDTQYHTLTAIQVIAGASAGPGSFRRHLNGINLLNFNRNFIFHIRGRCRGCSSSTALFNDVVGRRRQLEGESAMTTLHADESMTDWNLPLHHPVSSLEGSTQAVVDYPGEAMAFPDSFHRQLPVIDGQCYCQATTTSRRIPNKGEFIQALNDRFKSIGPQGAGVVTIASTVQNIAQLVQLNCSSRVNTFSTTVTVGIRSNRTLPSTVLAQLGTTFQTIYNALNQRYCDPIFRVVQSVQVKYRRRQLEHVVAIEDEPDTAQRGLQQQQQRVAFLHFVVQGQCRGCSASSTNLFSNNGAGRSLQHTDKDWEPSSGEASDPIEVPSRVRLQAYNQTYVQSSCYCRANSIAFTAPTAYAFQQFFNRSVTALDKSLAVYSVN